MHEYWLTNNTLNTDTLNKTVINTNYDKITGMLEVHKSLYTWTGEEHNSQICSHPWARPPPGRHQVSKQLGTLHPGKNLTQFHSKYNNGQKIQVNPYSPHRCRWVIQPGVMECQLGTSVRCHHWCQWLNQVTLHQQCFWMLPGTWKCSTTAREELFIRCNLR